MGNRSGRVRWPQARGALVSWQAKGGVRVGRVGLQREMAASGSVPCEGEVRVVRDGRGTGINMCPIEACFE